MTGVITMLLVMKKNVASITSATSRVMSRSFLGFAVHPADLPLRPTAMLKLRS